MDADLHGTCGVAAGGQVVCWAGCSGVTCPLLVCVALCVLPQLDDLVQQQEELKQQRLQQGAAAAVAMAAGEQRPEQEQQQQQLSAALAAAQVGCHSELTWAAGCSFV